MRVASKVGNLPSKCGRTRPLGSRIVRYVRDGRTDRRTDRQKQRLLLLSLLAGHNNVKLVHWPLMGGLLHLVQRGEDWTRLSGFNVD